MKKRGKGGQALLLVMWAMFVMSFSILGLVRLLNITVGTSAAMERLAIASSLAYSGITLGRNVQFPDNGRTEHRKYENGAELIVRAVSENSKFNINYLIQNQDRDTLRALFRIWGLRDADADTVLDCLWDYVEPGTTRRLNGAKAEQYRQAGRQPPPGRPFRSVEEMNRVLNFHLVAQKKGNWQEYFTIYGDGTLDLTTAPPDLIRAVCRVGEASAHSILQLRDNEATPFSSIDEARQAMGLTEKEFAGVQGRLSLGGKVRRIHATAKFAQTEHHIEAIYRLDPNAAIILDWREW